MDLKNMLEIKHGETQNEYVNRIFPQLENQILDGTKSFHKECSAGREVILTLMENIQDKIITVNTIEDFNENIFAIEKKLYDSIINAQNIFLIPCKKIVQNLKIDCKKQIRLSTTEEERLLNSKLLPCIDNMDRSLSNIDNEFKDFIQYIENSFISIKIYIFKQYRQTLSSHEAINIFYKDILQELENEELNVFDSYCDACASIKKITESNVEKTKELIDKLKNHNPNTFIAENHLNKVSDQEHDCLKLLNIAKDTYTKLDYQIKSKTEIYNKILENESQYLRIVNRDKTISDLTKLAFTFDLKRSIRILDKLIKILARNENNLKDDINIINELIRDVKLYKEF